MAQTQSLPQWNQQPDGFAGLKFGANKTAVEQQIKVEASSSYEDVLVLVTRFTFCEVEILGRCVFLANQLSAIAGDFALSEWDLVLSAFTETYGYNHCEVSDFWTNDVPYVGLTWTGG